MSGAKALAGVIAAGLAALALSAGGPIARASHTAAPPPSLGAKLTGPGSLPASPSYCAKDQALTGVKVGSPPTQTTPTVWCTTPFKLTMSFPLAGMKGAETSLALGAIPVGVKPNYTYDQQLGVGWCGLHNTGAGCGNVVANPNGQSATLFIYGRAYPVATYHPERICAGGFVRVPPGASQVYQACASVISINPVKGSPKPPTAKLGIDWSMPERLTAQTPFSEHWGSTDGLPPKSSVYPADWDVSLFLTSGGRPTCPAGTTYIWTVVGGGKSQTLPGKACHVVATVPSLGAYSVTAKEFKGGPPTGKKPSTSVQVRDFLIVGLGDSNGSGEGNAPFYYDRCNRSVYSYQFQTALYVERQDPHSSVTFIHASCSGARIDHVATTSFEGTRAETPPLAPQVTQVSRLLSQGSPVRKIDAVILSAGVNDLGFGPILSFCVKESLLSRLTPCEGIPAVPKVDSVNRVVGFTAVHGSTTIPTLGDQLAILQNELPGRFPPLAKALRAPVGPNGGLAMAAKDVFLTQYPDFTNGDAGTPCGPTALARFDTTTWTWLGLNAALLNRAVATAAARGGATLVPVNTAAFAKRGYCSSHSLFHGIFGTAAAQFDVAGPFHPDREAHLIQAAEVEPLLCKRIGLDATCEGP